MDPGGSIAFGVRGDETLDVREDDEIDRESGGILDVWKPSEPGGDLNSKMGA